MSRRIAPLTLLCLFVFAGGAARASAQGRAPDGKELKQAEAGRIKSVTTRTRSANLLAGEVRDIFQTSRAILQTSFPCLPRSDETTHVPAAPNALRAPRR